MKTKSGKVRLSITLTKEVHELLETLCESETRARGRQITWIIKQYWAIKKTHPELGLSQTQHFSLLKYRPEQDVIKNKVIPFPVSSVRK